MFNTFQREQEGLQDFTYGYNKVNGKTVQSRLSYVDDAQVHLKVSFLQQLKRFEMESKNLIFARYADIIFTGFSPLI
jgi:hypothetical protein